MKVLLCLWDGFSKEADVPAADQELTYRIDTGDGVIVGTFKAVLGAGNALGMPVYGMRSWSLVPRGTQRTQNATRR